MERRKQRQCIAKEKKKRPTAGFVAKKKLGKEWPIGRGDFQTSAEKEHGKRNQPSLEGRGEKARKRGEKDSVALS